MLQAVVDELQRQAQALGDPSRFTIFEHIARSPTPVGIAELTTLMGFNHNAIRQHLIKLLDADLITESTEKRSTRGRPRLIYLARSDAFDRFQNRPGGSYQRLAALLLDLATSGDLPYEVGRRSISRGAAPHGDESDPDPVDAPQTVEALAERLEQGGFSPSVNGMEVELGRCPFADLAAVHPEIVCELHRGLIDGFLAQVPGNSRASLTPEPPHSAGCTVRIDPSR